MVSHEENLSKLCRLCGKKIILKHGYKKAKSVEEYSDILFQYYDIDVSLESCEVYPKHLCGNCRRNLDRLKKGEATSSKLTAPFEFVQHSENCYVCSQFSESITEKLNLRKLDSSMREMGYVVDINRPGFKRIYVKLSLVNDLLQTKIVIFVKSTNEFYCQINGVKVTPGSLLLNLPETLNEQNMESFTSFFKNIDICEGIKEFQDVISARLEIKQPFPSDTGNLTEIVEYQGHAQLIKANFEIVRHLNCSYFVDLDEKICKSCQNYTNFLRSSRSRIKINLEPEKKKQRVSDSSKTNVRYLTREELEERLSQAQSAKREALKKVSNMAIKIKKLIQEEGVIVTEEESSLFKDIITSNTPEFEEFSPQELLWNQQKEQAGKSNSRGMRWHPLIIRWCLSIYYTSPAAYRQMSSKKLNFLKLHHVNTLRKYGQFTNPCSGFNPDIINRLMIDAKVDTLKDFQRNVSLCFDEMKIKSNLVYSKSTGKLVGFTEMGEINEEIKKFQETFEEDSTAYEHNLSSHVIVYMVRGIFTNLAYPFAYFGSNGFSSAQLYPCTLEATKILTSIGFHVRAFVSDGATPNRKFYKMMCTDDPDNINWTWNPFEEDEKIYFFSDPPHLLKTTRNCMENSQWNCKTRNLHVSCLFSLVQLNLLPCGFDKFIAH